MSRPDRNNLSQTARPQNRGGYDPYLYASLLTSGNLQNPLQVLAGELTQKLTSLITMRQNMKAAEARLTQMRTQIDKVEGQIAEVNKKESGHRLNKLR